MVGHLGGRRCCERGSAELYGFEYESGGEVDHLFVLRCV